MEKKFILEVFALTVLSLAFAAPLPPKEQKPPPKPSPLSQVHNVQHRADSPDSTPATSAPASPVAGPATSSSTQPQQMRIVQGSSQSPAPTRPPPPGEEFVPRPPRHVSTMPNLGSPTVGLLSSSSSAVTPMGFHNPLEGLGRGQPVQRIQTSIPGSPTQICSPPGSPVKPVHR